MSMDLGPASDSSPYQEFVEHWTHPDFTHYVAALGELSAPERFDDIVAEVLMHETAFWSMAL